MINKECNIAIQKNTKPRFTAKEKTMQHYIITVLRLVYKNQDFYLLKSFRYSKNSTLCARREDYILMSQSARIQKRVNGARLWTWLWMEKVAWSLGGDQGEMIVEESMFHSREHYYTCIGLSSPSLQASSILTWYAQFSWCTISKHHTERRKHESDDTQGRRGKQKQGLQPVKAKRGLEKRPTGREAFCRLKWMLLLLIQPAQ